MATLDEVVMPGSILYEDDLPRPIQQVGFSGLALRIDLSNTTLTIGGKLTARSYIKLLRSLYPRWKPNKPEVQKLEYLIYAEKLAFESYLKTDAYWEKRKMEMNRLDLDINPGKYEEHFQALEDANDNAIHFTKNPPASQGAEEPATNNAIHSTQDPPVSQGVEDPAADKAEKKCSYFNPKLPKEHPWVPEATASKESTPTHEALLSSSIAPKPTEAHASNSSIQSPPVTGSIQTSTAINRSKKIPGIEDVQSDAAVPTWQFDSRGLNRHGYNAVGQYFIGMDRKPVLQVFDEDGLDQYSNPQVMVQGGAVTSFLRFGNYDNAEYQLHEPVRARPLLEDGCDKQGFDKHGYNNAGYTKAGVDKFGIFRGLKYVYKGKEGMAKEPSADPNVDYHKKIDQLFQEKRRRFEEEEKARLIAEAAKGHISKKVNGQAVGKSNKKLTTESPKAKKRLEKRQMAEDIDEGSVYPPDSDEGSVYVPDSVRKPTTRSSRVLEKRKGTNDDDAEYIPASKNMSAARPIRKLPQAKTGQTKEPRRLPHTTGMGTKWKPLESIPQELRPKTRDYVTRPAVEPLDNEPVRVAPVAYQITGMGTRWKLLENIPSGATT